MHAISHFEISIAHVLIRGLVLIKTQTATKHTASAGSHTCVRSTCSNLKLDHLFRLRNTSKSRLSRCSFPGLFSKPAVGLLSSLRSKGQLAHLSSSHWRVDHVHYKIPSIHQPSTVWNGQLKHWKRCAMSCHQYYPPLSSGWLKNVLVAVSQNSLRTLEISKWLIKSNKCMQHHAYDVI